MRKIIHEEDLCLQATLLPRNEIRHVQFVKVQRASLDE